MDTKEKSIHAKVAQNVREELKKHFPNIKFSVRSAIYAGGNSVYIDYKDEILKREEIEKVVEKYQSGHFDGMTDCYIYYDRPYPTVRHVLVSNLY